MQGRRVPAKGKGELGSNEWEWFNHERGEKSGTFVRTGTKAERFTGVNRHQRRKAITMKRRGLA
jgi:hypothetical protein